MTDEREPLVVADGLSLRTKQGPVFADLHFTWPGLGPVAVTGPAGSGRSSVLLAVGGRMRGLTGRLSVAGIDAIRRPAEVRAITSVARIADLVRLESRLRVAECITERALIDAVAPQRAEVAFGRLESTLGVAFPRQALVDDLPALEQTVLAVVLATLRPARLVLLDDADARIDLADQHRLFEALRTICATLDTAIAFGTTETAALPTDLARLDLTRPDSVTAPKD